MVLSFCYVPLWTFRLLDIFDLPLRNNSNYRYQFTKLAKQTMLMNTDILKHLSNNIVRDHPKMPSVNLESAT